MAQTVHERTNGHTQLDTTRLGVDRIKPWIYMTISSGSGRSGPKLDQGLIILGSGLRGSLSDPYGFRWSWKVKKVIEGHSRLWKVLS